MNGRKGKRGQVAIFLVALLAGLLALFLLNLDVFRMVAAKAKAQNAADASALALSRWQGITLNTIGDLNLWHIAEICESNENAIAAIVGLQRQLAFIMPTIGLRAANEIARENDIPVSAEMTRIVRIVADTAGGDYGTMLRTVADKGIRAGVDNALLVKSDDLRFNYDFYCAIRDRNWVWFCRHNGWRHSLPNVPNSPPSADDYELNLSNAIFGGVGVGAESDFSLDVGDLILLAKEGKIGGEISFGDLAENSFLISQYRWYKYDTTIWHDWTDYNYPNFPSVSAVRNQYYTSGGSGTIRIEAPAGTNCISSRAAAKTFGSMNGRRVDKVTGRLVMPAFSFVRLVPFGPGCGGRTGYSYLRHIQSILELLGKGGSTDYRRLLNIYNSTEFKSAADAWYSSHEHDEYCCPPSSGDEGGGTPYAM